MKYDFIVGDFQPLNNLKPGHMKPGVKITYDSLLGASLLQTRVHTPGLFSGFRSSLSIPCLSLSRRYRKAHVRSSPVTAESALSFGWPG